VQFPSSRITYRAHETIRFIKMAEVLAGLSLASNIAQFVAMGLKASVFLLQAYKAGDEFVQDQAQLRIKIDGLKDCLHILDSDIEFSARDNLAAIYRQAIELCRKMNQELDKLDNISAGGGRVARWTRAIRVIRKRSEIEGLMKKLESFELPIVLELQVCAE
jgi:hypothetical protein